MISRLRVLARRNNDVLLSRAPVEFTRNIRGNIKVYLEFPHHSNGGENLDRL